MRACKHVYMAAKGRFVVYMKNKCRLSHSRGASGDSMSQERIWGLEQGWTPMCKELGHMLDDVEADGARPWWLSGGRIRLMSGTNHGV